MSEAKKSLADMMFNGTCDFMQLKERSTESADHDEPVYTLHDRLERATDVLEDIGDKDAADAVIQAGKRLIWQESQHKNITIKQNDAYKAVLETLRAVRLENDDLKQSINILGGIGLESIADALDYIHNGGIKPLFSSRITRIRNELDKING